MKNLKEEIYHHEERLTAYLRWIAESKNITKNNKNVIKEFICELRANGLSLSRQVMYARFLRQLCEAVPIDFKKITKQDMQKYFGDMNGRYADWTMTTNKSLVKYFWRWLYGLPKGHMPEQVSWIEIVKPKNQLRKEDLITYKEYQKILEATQHIRIKAMLSVHYQTGVRPSELLLLNISDVLFHKNYVEITISKGKMDKKMSPRIVIVKAEAYIYLKNWMDSHQSKSKDSPLWMTTSGNRETLRSYSKNIKSMVKRAGISKRIFPYLLRHTALTRLYLKHGSIIGAKIAGHSFNSREIGTYVHLSDSDVIDAVVGEKKSTFEETEHKCRCGFFNPKDTERCTQCGLLFNGIDETEDRLAKMEQLVARLLEKQGNKDICNVEVKG